MEKEKNRIREIDALRGIAAFAVLLFHFTMFREQAKLGFNVGCMGVDMFFIISGFVILMTIEKMITWQEFAVSRFSRLFPAYWVCVTITALAILFYSMYSADQHMADNLLGKYLINLSMLQYYFNVADIDEPYWTLIIELVFYSFMLLLFITKNIKRIEIISVVVLCFALLYSLPAIRANYVMYKVYRAIPLITYFPLFFSGILFYKMKVEEKTIYRVLLVIACFAVQLMLYSSYYLREFVSSREYLAVLSIIYAVFTLFLFGKLSFIVNRVTMWLGNISYSLYLIHQFISTKIVIPELMKRGVNFWIASLIAMIVIMILATLINIYVENPARKYIRGRFKVKAS